MLFATDAIERTRELAIQPTLLDDVRQKLAAELHVPVARITGFLDRLIDAGAIVEVAKHTTMPSSTFEARDQMTAARDPSILHQARTRKISVWSACPAEGSLPELVRADVARYGRLCAFNGFEYTLARAHAAFVERYGPYEAAPLLEVADLDVGIGRSFLKPEDTAPLVDHDRLRLKILTECAASGANTYEIAPEDSAQEMPSGSFAMGGYEFGVTIQARTPSDLSNGNYLIGPGQFAPRLGFTSSWGRFIGAGLPIPSWSAARAASPGDTLETELGFVPTDRRALNVCSDVTPFTHFLDLGGRFAAAAARRIDPRDVDVRSDGRFLELWSRSVGKRIDIRQSNLINLDLFGDELTRIVNAIAMQGTHPRAPWTWGQYARFAVHVPRITSGRLVLAPERWTLSYDAVRTAMTSSDTWSKLMTDIGLPRRIALVTQQRHMPLDLHADVSRDLAMRAMKRWASDGEPIVFEELFPGLDSEWFLRNGKAHAVELVFTMVTERSTVSPRARGSSPASERTPEAPSHRWEYLKLYAHRLALDHLIIRVSRDLSLIGKTGGWFFVRYADDRGSHLRLRVEHAAHEEALRTILLECADAWVRDGYVETFQLTNYVPECGRYGGERVMVFAEAVFCADSRACVAAAAHDEPPLRRIGIDSAKMAGWLNAALSSTTLAQLITHLRPQRRKSSTFEREAARYARSVGESVDYDDTAAAFVASLALYDTATASTLPSALVASAIESFIHMHCNRMGFAPEYEESYRRLILERLRAINRAAR